MNDHFIFLFITMVARKFFFAKFFFAKFFFALVVLTI